MRRVGGHTAPPHPALFTSQVNGELLPGNFWVKYPADDSEALHRLRLSEYLTNLSGEGAAAEQWALLEPAPADAPAREEGTQAADEGQLRARKGSHAREGLRSRLERTTRACRSLPLLLPHPLPPHAPGRSTTIMATTRSSTWA